MSPLLTVDNSVDGQNDESEKVVSVESQISHIFFRALLATFADYVLIAENKTGKTEVRISLHLPPPQIDFLGLLEVLIL